MNTQVVILGMHRTTSSLIANWLHDCGLHLGDELLNPSSHNQKGYFEDIDFVKLHQKILTDAGMDQTGLFKSIPPPINSDSLQQAKDLIKKKNKMNEVWGFKDPRSCLFCNTLYKDTLSNPYYIITTRDYKEVVNSILNREFKKPKTLPKTIQQLKIRLYRRYIYPSMILSAWVNYNQEILRLLKNINNDKFLVLNKGLLLTKSSEVFNQLKELNILSNYVNPSTIYSSGLISKRERVFQIYNWGLEKKAKKIQLDLNNLLFEAS